MKTPEERLNELGFSLPPPIILPEGLHLPFSFVIIRGNRAFISGHPRLAIEGAIDGPYGKLGRDLTMDQGKAASREIALSVLSNLKKEIGELSRVTGWCRVFGMVNSTQDFDEQHLVINGFSDLIIEVFGQGIGNHARSAIGVSGLPMNFAIEIEGELEIN
jgi:enamine deaminase RidA (YjgF/YER057c/UK114 family)